MIVRESIKESGIPWSGKDPTKAKVIGRIVTKKMDLGSYHLESEAMNVVEISDDIYIINKWYKSGVPQVVHSDMVEDYYPVHYEKDLEESGISGMNL